VSSSGTRGAVERGADAEGAEVVARDQLAAPDAGHAVAADQGVVTGASSGSGSRTRSAQRRESRRRGGVGERARATRRPDPGGGEADSRGDREPDRPCPRPSPSHGPELFCDEPSAGLDPLTSAELDELILRLRDRFGMAIVVVTHELMSIERIADRAVMLSAGKVLADGSLAEVRATDHPEIHAFFERIAAGEVRGLPLGARGPEEAFVSQPTRAQKLRLGIFLAVGLTVLVGGLVILAGMKLGEQRDRYRVRWTDGAVSLSGLEIGSPVKYSGIRVGRVDSVRIDPDDVGVIVVELSLDGGTPVAEDTKANLGSQGISGLKYIELSRGSASARLRKPGEEIPAGSSLFDSLAGQAEDIARKVDAVLDRLVDLTGPDMKARIAGVLERSDQLMGTVDGLLQDNREALKTLASRLAGTATQVEAMAAELAGTARRANLLLDESAALLRSARATPERVNAFLEQGTAVLASTRTLLGADGLQKALGGINSVDLQSRHEVIEAIAYLRETAENMSALSQRLRDDPSLLIRGESEGDEP
jgi:phospholipid/cholesterol/gamma-HCH transport system substrate-binding protein